MVRMDRILRDYRDAGSLNGLLALWGFVDDTTFLTKAGHVGVVYRLRGVDYEGLRMRSGRSWPTGSRQASACSTSTVASTSTSSSAASRPSSPPRARNPSRMRRFSAARPT